MIIALSFAAMGHPKTTARQPSNVALLGYAAQNVDRLCECRLDGACSWYVTAFMFSHVMWLLQYDSMLIQRSATNSTCSFSCAATTTNLPLFCSCYGDSPTNASKQLSFAPQSSMSNIMWPFLTKPISIASIYTVNLIHQRVDITSRGQ